MKIYYSKHAEKRMKERGIKNADVVSCIEMPHYAINKKNIVESHKKIFDKTIKVVWTRKDNFIKVISVMWK